MACLERDAAKENVKAILNMLEPKTDAKMVDLGCSSGENTVKFANAVGTKDLYGVDLHPKACALALEKGIKIARHDLNTPFPFEEEFFDVIIANNVIEHIRETDLFVNEIYRILKPNGYVVVSTENLSGSHNMLALLLGYQPFFDYVSKVYYIGNPFFFHRKTIGEPTVIHYKLFAFQALVDILEVYHFKVESVKGAGYPPFLGSIAWLLCRLDPKHSRYIIAKARKYDAQI